MFHGVAFFRRVNMVCAMSAQFDALANTVFDWRQHLEEAPCLRDVPEEQQRDLIATYLQEHTDWLQDVWSYVDDREALTVAQMITGNIDGDSRVEFADALYNAARAALKDTVEDRITILYERYVAEYGEFSVPDLYGPSELIGWRNPDERI